MLAESGIQPVRGSHDAPPSYLATLPARPVDCRLAIATIAASAVLFLLLAPAANLQLGRIDAFIPAYQSALILNDLITALLLYGKAVTLRSKPLVALAGGYLFTALMAIAHALTFPGLFAPHGLLGATPQTTAWLYMFWHAGFPAAVILYALLPRSESDRGSSGTVFNSLVIVPLAVGVLIWLSTAGSAFLPRIMEGDNSAHWMVVVINTVWGISFLALAVLLVRRPYSVLDLWLMVVICAWICEIGLSAVLNEGRFVLGWYAGRIYGLFAASFVLANLLIQTASLYGRLAHALTAEARMNERLEALVTERTRALSTTQANLENEVAVRREAETELTKARTFLDLVIENIPATIIVKDAVSLRMVLVNATAEEALGLPRDQLIGKTSYDLLSEENAQQIVARDRRALATKEITTVPEEVIQRPGKPMRHVRTRLAPVLGADGEPKYLIIIGENVSELRKVEQQLQQAQKLEAIGQLTGGLAHDFNNLLGIVLGNLDMLIEECEAGSDQQQLAGEALEAAQRGAELTRQLLAFSRRQPLAPHVIEPSETLNGMAQMLRRTLGESITFRIEVGEQVWPLLVDVSQLESAILNLAVNARDAMPGGGTLTVEMHNIMLGEEAAEINPEAAPGDYVVISVSDTGCGMTPEVMSRVFEPFFTTKDGKGTGLGLSMVHGFLKQSGGYTRIYSEPGHGTTVRLYLPRAAAATAAAAHGAVTRVAGGNELVLVVEDNPGLRQIVIRQLQSLGYRTMAADGPGQALDIVRNGAPIDLLFTDVVMPGGVDGRGLADKARQLRPSLKVLFTSGFTPAAASAAMTDDFTSNLLTKPYRKEDLARRVRLALDSHVLGSV